MRLFSLSVIYKGTTKTNLLKAAYDLSTFGYFQRGSAQEFMTFTSALIVERTSQGSRASVKEQEYLCHVYVRNDNLGAVVIADTEYPQRVCFSLLDKVLEEFSRQVDSIDWPSGNPETINYKALDIHLAKYQKPQEADAMTKVQAELDETKIILHNTMESLLERGEKLDDLVAKSEHLGNQSKAFYKTVNDPDLIWQRLNRVPLRNSSTAVVAHTTIVEDSVSGSSGIVPEIRHRIQSSDP
uniref:YKT6 v-SNARE homolog (S. cerevisiae) n=1 Tax=Neogobius melanostomus TaxID=47308 RepID=A0A8C6SEE4_9GOBI